MTVEEAQERLNRIMNAHAAGIMARREWTVSGWFEQMYWRDRIVALKFKYLDLP